MDAEHAIANFKWTDTASPVRTSNSVIDSRSLDRETPRHCDPPGMITVRPQKNLKVAKNYFREHLCQGDYYSEKQSVVVRCSPMSRQISG